MRFSLLAPGPPSQGVQYDPESLKKPRFSAINWPRKASGVPPHPKPMLARLLVFPHTNDERYQHGSHGTGSPLRQGHKRPYKVSDASGLYLFVQPSGQRYRRLAYRWAASNIRWCPESIPRSASRRPRQGVLSQIAVRADAC